MSATVQQILQAAYPEYAGSHPVAAHVRCAMWWVLRCGTGVLGVFARRCPQGHFAEVEGCCCGHRVCPACRATRALRWLDQWGARLLPTGHFHVILTIASELHPLWQHNRKRMAALLFVASRDTLMELLADPTYLGAVPGLLMALHTWGRNLFTHLHTHIVVSAGGIDAHGQWKPIPRDFLLPGKVVRAVFRGKFCDLVQRAWENGEVGLPPPWDEATMRRALRRARRKKWNVRIEAPYAHGQGVVNYLARYVCGGPIGSSRIRRFDGKEVIFEVGRKETEAATMTLGAEEFVRRWIEHIPEPGLHMVRAYGLYSSARREDREACRVQLRPRGSEPAAQSNEPRCCPVCGAVMIIEQSERPRRRHAHRGRQGERRWPPARAPESARVAA
jgi:hypothetical protein